MIGGEAETLVCSIDMTYSVSSDRLRGRFQNLSLTDARKRAYRMLNEHPRTDATVIIDGTDREYCEWTVMHCGKRFITRRNGTNIRILRKDGTTGIIIKKQRVYCNRKLIGYRYYGGDEPTSGVYVDLEGKVRR